MILHNIILSSRLVPFGVTRPYSAQASSASYYEKHATDYHGFSDIIEKLK